MSSFIFDEWYKVCDDGRVFSLDREIQAGIHKRYFYGKELTPHYTSRGVQVHCHLSTGKDVFLTVSKLVYVAFCMEHKEDFDFFTEYYRLGDDDVIVHIDGDMNNNVYTNLTTENKNLLFLNSINAMRERYRAEGIEINSGNYVYLKKQPIIKKNDEFYTPYDKIEEELCHYPADFFRGKVVYSNCDSVDDSMFVKYFEDNFARLGIKKYIATCMDNGVFKAKKLELTEGSRTVTDLTGNGSFDSPECVALLDEADIIVTNPPFSIIRRYMRLLFEHNKEYLIMSPLWALGYKEFNKKIVERSMFIGYNGQKNIKFIDPESTKKRVLPCVWLTTFEKEYPPFLELVHKYSPDEYPTYTNCDAIEVNSVDRIPKDYYGVMGVPTSFLTKWNPDQFTLIGKPTKPLEFINKRGEIRKPFTRMLIKRIKE